MYGTCVHAFVSALNSELFWQYESPKVLFNGTLYNDRKILPLLSIVVSSQVRLLSS